MTKARCSESDRLDTISMLLLFYVALIVPVRIAYDLSDHCPSAVWIFESVIDMFFLCDLILHFFTGEKPQIQDARS